MVSCSKVTSFETPVNSTPIVIVQTSLQGHIIDEQGVPVLNAIVSAGGHSDTTDDNGNWYIDNVNADENATVVTVNKAGYVQGVRTLMVNDSARGFVQVVLLEKPSPVTADNSTGSHLTFTNGDLTLAPNQVLNVQQLPYDGTIGVQFNYISPAMPDFADRMPGDNRGRAADSSETGLQTFTMASLLLGDNNGTPLQLDPTTPATLNLRIPPAMVGMAPDTIALWRFDAGSGFWRLAGKAVKQGNNYSAPVTGAGYWQCAVAFPITTFSTNLVNMDRNRISNAAVTIATKIDLIPTNAFTDDKGNLNVKVPKDNILVLSVNDPCYKVVSHQEIGPFNGPSSIDTIQTPILGYNMLYIDGMVRDCMGVLVDNGKVDIEIDGLKYKTTLMHGAYKLGMIRCRSTNANIIFTAKDLEAGVQSITTTYTSNGVLTNTLVVCKQ